MRPLRAESSECHEWAEAWRSHRARSALESNLSRAGLSEEEFWSRYPSWVARFQGDYPGVLLQHVTGYLRPDGTVLDIGAGAGAFAIPLAAAARRVTAVEPSPSQVRQLRENMKRAQISNIDVIESRWEDVDTATLESHDLVLAVHSLQMQDIATALRHMCRAASHCLLLVHTAGHSLSRLSHELFDIEPDLTTATRANPPRPRLRPQWSSWTTATTCHSKCSWRYFASIRSERRTMHELACYVTSRGMTTYHTAPCGSTAKNRDALVSVTPTQRKRRRACNDTNQLCQHDGCALFAALIGVRHSHPSSSPSSPPRPPPLRRPCLAHPLRQASRWCFELAQPNHTRQRTSSRYGRRH